MSITLLLILYCALAYVLGSVSSAILVCRLMNLPDPRLSGSNNPGATNVLRIGGKLPALLTLLGDLLKGLIPVLIAKFSHPEAYFVGPVMVAAFLGHLYPVFFNFKGGKGVATFLGTLFGLYWPIAIFFVMVWLIVVIFSRMSSLGALVAALLTPIFAGAFLGIFYAIPILIMVIFILIRHRSNIVRILKGQEPKIRKKIIS